MVPFRGWRLHIFPVCCARQCARRVELLDTWPLFHAHVLSAASDANASWEIVGVFAAQYRLTPLRRVHHVKPATRYPHPSYVLQWGQARRISSVFPSYRHLRSSLVYETAPRKAGSLFRSTTSPDLCRPWGLPDIDFSVGIASFSNLEMPQSVHSSTRNLSILQPPTQLISRLQHSREG
ncbi:hypothetical protein BV25DRAFT_912011 [Artomyces pyxidatus]|uniref:Uncharacterized protein n=1 Tax=Artomyces pyxidatus TaxID=48021 RepID=A0ACB8SXH9_9AGAM|nr:hypothetical protein BV25DRAFT_912011 [Artomyces pyxidatus]